jgi:hypothetical protein
MVSVQEKALTMRAITINPDFHNGKKWVFPAMWNLIERIKNDLGCVFISCQEDYDKIANDLEWVFVNQPGWSAPWIKFDPKKDHKISMIISDPHDKTDWLPKYVEENGVDHLLCMYWQASLKYLPTIPRDKFVFFPWSIPEEYCLPGIMEPMVKDRLMIFGSMDHPAYALRRWCCGKPFVEKHNRSLNDIGNIPYSEYMKWLGRFGAIVCAGSWEYQFIFPKTYEAAAAGALVFLHEVSDLPLCGFNVTNCVPFREENFDSLAKSYIASPNRFDEVRMRGQELIRSRHLVKNRISKLNVLIESDNYVEEFDI